MLDGIELPPIAAGVPHLAYRALLDHPALPAARKVYLDAFLSLYGDDRFLTRLLIETSRFLVFTLVVVLAAGHDPMRRETWLTIGRLKRAMAGIGQASDRQIDALVARLREVGFLTAEPLAADRRVRILAPTERMLAHDRAWLAAHYAPLAHLSPDHDYAPALRGDPAYQVAHRRTSLAFMAVGARLMLGEADMMLFFDRAAGHLVLAALLQAAMADPDQVAAPVPYATVGDRFGVSRTHVRQLLEAAAARGLVRLQARGGRAVEILPRLWRSYDRGIVGGLYLHDLVHGVVVGRRAAAAD